MCQSGRTTGGIRTIPIYGGPNLRGPQFTEAFVGWPEGPVQW